MQFSRFRVGRRFWSTSGPWLCTDLGRRVVVAIPIIADRSWMIGPPYALAEGIFDEHDQEGCVATVAAARRNGWRTGPQPHRPVFLSRRQVRVLARRSRAKGRPR